MPLDQTGLTGSYTAIRPPVEYQQIELFFSVLQSAGQTARSSGQTATEVLISWLLSFALGILVQIQHKSSAVDPYSSHSY